MKNSFVTLIGLLISIYLGVGSLSHASSSTESNPAFREYMEAGWIAYQQRKLRDSAHSFEDAFRVATINQSKSLALLELARVNLKLLSTDNQCNSEAFNKLDWAYQIVLEIGNPEQKLQVANNLGIIYTRCQNYDEAIVFFQKGSESAILVDLELPLTLLGRYYTNYARALDLSGKSNLALEKYFTAIKYDPNQGGSREAAINIVESHSSIPIDKATTLGSLLLEGEDKLLARTFVLNQLAIRHREQGSQKLLSVMLQYYIAVNVSPPEFAVNEWPELELIASQGGPLRTSIKQVYAAYFDQPGQISESVLEKIFKAPYFWRKTRFSAWTQEPYVRAFTPLLNLIAEYYASQNQLENAFVRFSVVWEIDPGNSDAGLAAARLFTSKETLPGQEGQKVIGQMTGFLEDPWFDSDGRFITEKRQITYDDLDLWNMYWMYSLLAKSPALEKPLRVEQWEVTRQVLTITAKSNRVENTPNEGRSDRRELLAERLRQRGATDAAYNLVLAAAKQDAYTSKGFDDTDVLSLLINPSQPALLEKMRLAVEDAQFKKLK